MTTRLPLAGIAALLLGSLAAAADWPQFEGPRRDAISTETGLLKSWPKDGPKLAWSFKNAGLGFSSFAVVDGKLYTLGTRGKSEIVLCLDAAKGTELWTMPLGPIFSFQYWGDGPRSTPTVDGKHLYALGGTGTLVCLDVAGAMPKEVWRKDLVKDMGGEMMDSGGSWGYSESPLVDGKLLICTPGGAQGTVAALDKLTGAVVWRSKELTDRAPYTSAMVAEFHGVRQVIQTSFRNEPISGHLSGIAIKDGTLLWSQPIFKKSSYAIAPTPRIDGNRIYVTSGYGGGCHLFAIDKGQKAKDLYSKAIQKKLSDTHGGVVILDGHVFGHAEQKRWVCQDLKSGMLTWDEKDELSCESGSTLAADGMLYLVTDEGEVALAAADPKEFKLVSRFKLPEASQYRNNPKFPNNRGSRVWGHPAIANGQLFLRDEELIFCYDVRDKK